MDTPQVAGQILLANADIEVNDDLTALLEGWQFHVVSVATPAEVETTCAIEYFDLVLLDFMDGEREGVAVVERLAALPDSPPIVIYTEPEIWKVVSTLLEGKVAGFLPKPFDIETDLFPLLGQFFEQAEPTDASDDGGAAN